MERGRGTLSPFRQDQRKSHRYSTSLGVPLSRPSFLGEEGKKGRRIHKSGKKIVDAGKKKKTVVSRVVPKVSARAGLVRGGGDGGEGSLDVEG